MIRNLGRILALAAVLASAINAQCALTCSVKVPLVRPSHACCPDKSTPAKPCPTPTPAVAELEVSSAPQLAGNFHFSGIRVDSFDYRAILARVSVSRQEDGTTGTPNLSSFLILRV